MSKVHSGDDVSVYGTVTSPFQGTNGYGGPITSPEITVKSFTDLGHAHRHVNWAGCNKANAILTGANLYNAVLTGAHLSGANQFSAQLSDADLWHADLSGANLTNVYWANTTCPDVLIATTTSTPASATC